MEGKPKGARTFLSACRHIRRGRRIKLRALQTKMRIAGWGRPALAERRRDAIKTGRVRAGKGGNVVTGVLIGGRDRAVRLSRTLLIGNLPGCFSGGWQPAHFPDTVRQPEPKCGGIKNQRLFVACATKSRMNNKPQTSNGQLMVCPPFGIGLSGFPRPTDKETKRQRAHTEQRHRGRFRNFGSCSDDEVVIVEGLNRPVVRGPEHHVELAHTVPVALQTMAVPLHLHQRGADTDRRGAAACAPASHGCTILPSLPVSRWRCHFSRHEPAGG